MKKKKPRDGFRLRGFQRLGEMVPLRRTLRRLEGPGRALGLNDLGEVVGFRKTDPGQMNEEPIFWDAAGVATQLPMPEGARQAHANQINKDGDVAGQATFPSGQIVAVLWVRGGAAQWAPVLLNGAEVLGLTDRRGDGTLLLSGIDGNPGCCQPFRWTVKIIDAAAGDVQTVREALGTDLFSAGSGSAINAAGDVAGYGRKGNTRSTPQPALFPIDGSTVSLPAGKSTYTGRVNGISLDRWMAGFVEGKAVVWHPSR